MSHEERYGTLVWDALVALFNAPETEDDEWITIGEVASKAEVSRPTAKKYLEELIRKGNAKRVTIGARKEKIMAYRPEWVTQ